MKPHLPKAYSTGPMAAATSAARNVCLENWNGILDWQKEFVYNGTLEQPTALGVLG